MVRHNNQVPNGHFKKHWQRRIRTWFDQPKKKERRRRLRHINALNNAPRPTAGLLRPIVQCPTIRYNMKQRAGRGFTFDELKKAGIDKNFARNIGISVDHRRRNKNEEHLRRNVDRLKEYKSKLILFPSNSKKPRKQDAKPEELKNATQNTSLFLFPFPRVPDTEVLRESETRAITTDEKDPKKSVVAKLKRARIALRLESRRRIRRARKQNRLEMEKKMETAGKKEGGDKKTPVKTPAKGPTKGGATKKEAPKKETNK
eukprot:TRINITY_DN408_c0_g1_i1.p1 TRINITY_DN408_c0_g1~~TRINITY_DN408_c0_g1_i1.p1  ORF type:complete len:259 (-),score=76.66 TRINITY_DN408_c0_g1_i1:43-819(-)